MSNPFDQFDTAPNPFDKFDAPAARKGFLEQVGDTIGGSYDKLKSDVNAGMKALPKKPPANAFSAIPDSIESLGRTAGLVGDVGGLILSPIAGAYKAGIVEPAARVLDAIPLKGATAPSYSLRDGKIVLTPSHEFTPDEKHAADVASVDTALSGVMPASPAQVARASAAQAARAAAPPNAFAQHVAKFDAAGVDPSIAAAGGKGASAVANAVAENFVAGGRARAAMGRQVGQVASNADRIAQGYGSTRGPQIAGEDVQAGVKAFAKDKDVPTSFAAKTGAAYDDVFDKLDTAMAGKTEPGRASAVVDDQFPGKVTVGGSQITTPATTAALSGIRDGVQSSSIADLIKDPTLSKAAKALSDANEAKDLSFSDLRRLRTWVRDAKSNPELRQSIGDANLGKLEGALTQDIYSNADALGSPTLAGQLRRTDQMYAAGMNRIQTALKPFADAKSGENAYSRIVQAAGSGSTADAQKLLSLKRSLAPEDWGDVAATTIKQLGSSTGSLDDFSLPTFVSGYAKMSPRGRQILFGSIGGGGAKATNLATELDNLVSVADDLKSLQKGANASKSGVSGQTVATLSGVGGGLTAAAMGHPAVLGATATGLGGMAVTGEMLTNPAAVRWLANMGKASKAGPQAVSSQLGRLRIAARSNVALLPLLHASEQALLPSPMPALAAPAAADEERK